MTNLASCKLGWGCLCSKDYWWIRHLRQHEIRGATFSPPWIPHEVDVSISVCANIYTSISSSTNGTVCLAGASSSTIGGWNEEGGGWEAVLGCSQLRGHGEVNTQHHAI